MTEIVVNPAYCSREVHPVPYPALNLRRASRRRGVCRAVIAGGRSGRRVHRKCIRFLLATPLPISYLLPSLLSIGKHRAISVHRGSRPRSEPGHPLSGKQQYKVYRPELTPAFPKRGPLFLVGGFGPDDRRLRGDGRPSYERQQDCLRQCSQRDAACPARLCGSI